MKSIIELCRQLPGSEAELRERALEFNQLVSLMVLNKPCGPDTNFILNIADAKAATDAMIGHGFDLEIEGPNGEWLVILEKALPQVQGNSPLVAFTPLPTIRVSVTASTEELARSAAALLAAEAMKENNAS